jgi:hypothetical protein
MKYLDNQQIPYNEVGSGVPNITELKYTHLTDDDRKFHFHNLNNDRYILFTNIVNDFSDKEIESLKKNWMVLHSAQCFGVTMTLYQHPD